MENIITTLGELRKLTNHLEDDFKIVFKTTRKLSDEELDPQYPYPIERIEREVSFTDIGYSDKVIVFDVDLDSYLD